MCCRLVEGQSREDSRCHPYTKLVLNTLNVKYMQVIETRKYKATTPKESFIFSEKKWAASGRTQPHNILPRTDALPCNWATKATRPYMYMYMAVHTPHTHTSSCLPSWICFSCWTMTVFNCRNEQQHNLCISRGSYRMLSLGMEGRKLQRHRGQVLGAPPFPLRKTDALRLIVRHSGVTY